MKITEKRLRKACDYLNDPANIKPGSKIGTLELAEALSVTIAPARLTVEISYDFDMECPNDMDCQWKLYCWDTRYRNSERPVSVGINEDDWTVFNPGLRSKLRVGLAFWLRYSEHGPPCRWDIGSAEKPDGILIWHHPRSHIGGKTYAERQKDAEAFLEMYTSWCNGDGYGFTVTDADGEYVDGCWGFYGCDLDSMAEAIRHVLKGSPYMLTGDGKDVIHDYQLKPQEKKPA